MSCKSQSIRVSQMKHILEGGMLPCVPLEVGCRGFPSSSVHHFLQKISLEPKQMKRPLEEIASTAEESSRWLWLTKDWSWNPSAGEARSSLSYSGEAFRLRGETLGILRYLLMQKGPAKATLSHQETCIKPKLLEYH